MNLYLKKPDITLKKEAIAFKQEFFDHGEMIIDGSDLLDQLDSYEEWLQRLKNNEDAETCDSNWVVSTTWFAMVDQTIVGIIDFRPHLKDALQNFGHIGYSTRPTYRRLGIAKEMLRQVLDIAKAHKLPLVTISCFEENVASRNTILSQGGVLQDTFVYQQKLAQRYFISL